MPFLQMLSKPYLFLCLVTSLLLGNGFLPPASQGTWCYCAVSLSLRLPRLFMSGTEDDEVLRGDRRKEWAGLRNTV